MEISKSRIEAAAEDVASLALNQEVLFRPRWRCLLGHAGWDSAPEKCPNCGSSVKAFTTIAARHSSVEAWPNEVLGLTLKIDDLTIPLSPEKALDVIAVLLRRLAVIYVEAEREAWTAAAKVSV